jgi:chaperonin GroES
VKPFEADELSAKSVSGIIIPDTVSKEKPEQGKVIAVGEGKFEDGKIVTDLSDPSFFELILKKWGGYNESEVDALMGTVTSEEQTDEWLKNEGVDFLENTLHL